MTTLINLQTDILQFINHELPPALVKVGVCPLLCMAADDMTSARKAAYAAAYAAYAAYAARDTAYAADAAYAVANAAADAADADADAARDAFIRLKKAKIYLGKALNQHEVDNHDHTH